MSHFITPRERGTRPVTGSTGAMQLAAAWKTVASGGTTRWATPGGTSHQPTNARRGGVAARSGRSRPVRDDLLATTPIVRVSFDRPWKSRRRIRPHRRRPGGEAPRPFQKKKLFALGGRRSAREKKKTRRSVLLVFCHPRRARRATRTPSVPFVVVVRSFHRVGAHPTRTLAPVRKMVGPSATHAKPPALASSQTRGKQTTKPKQLPNTTGGGPRRGGGERRRRSRGDEPR